MPKPFAPSSRALKGFPEIVEIDENTRTPIDLSGVKWKKLAGNKTEIVVEFSASAGSFDAVSTTDVAVTGSGGSTLRLTGNPKDIEKFFDNAEAVAYTGAEGDFGAAAATWTLSVGLTTGPLIPLVTTVVDIVEVPDPVEPPVVQELPAPPAPLPDEQIGTPQDDVLTGGEGASTIFGLGGNDLLSGKGGADRILGDEGNDTISGDAGADVLDGGAGIDLLMYRGSAAGVVVTLDTAIAGVQTASGGDAEGDVIANFENVYGSDHADVLTGDAGRNILFGYAGDDTISGGGGDDVIRGGKGADVLDGGDGADWLRYLGSEAGVGVDLAALALGGPATWGGDAEGDVISGFENIQGSDHGDTLAGDDAANYILGFAGDDDIAGGGGRDTIRGGEGADTLDGGDGTDTLQYLESTAGVVIDLRADEFGFGSASGGDAEGDVISGFENVYASDFDDVVTGDAARNILYGYDGRDVLNGGDGKDVLRGGADADTFVFDSDPGLAHWDRIVDFEVGLDAIHLAASAFSSLAAGALEAAAFLSAAGGLATDAAHRIVYDNATGDLYYDSDGSGAAEGLLFASLDAAPGLTETDFFVF